MRALCVFVALLLLISVGALVVGNLASQRARDAVQVSDEVADAVQGFIEYQDACQGSLIAFRKIERFQQELGSVDDLHWDANKNTTLTECFVSELLRVRMSALTDGDMVIDDLVLISILGDRTPLEVVGEIINTRVLRGGDVEADATIVVDPETFSWDLSERAVLSSLLSKIVQTYGLYPLPFREFEPDPKFTLGQMLFFDPILSGDRTVSCATCHLSEFATTDGRALSLGPGAEGIGPDRSLLSDTETHGRNSMDLWNRDHDRFRAAFWDGRVEMVDPIARVFRTPLGDAFPTGIENVLAAQALFPLLAPDEMLGEREALSPAGLDPRHASQSNALWDGIHDSGPLGASAVVFDNLMVRLLGSDTAQEDWQQEYRKLFEAAYPGRNPNSWSVVGVANAIAHFEELAFATRSTPWDQYLKGEVELSVPEMRGAMLFFGRGRCALCHNGPLFSDFEYHSVGIPAWNEALYYSDFGRFEVTGDEDDAYKFRTPPLRNVTVTNPYFHDGSQPDLVEAIWQHVDPYFFADNYRPDGGRLMELAEIEAIDPLLETIVLSRSDLESLVSFLALLEDAERFSDHYVPDRVPSGLRAH